MPNADKCNASTLSIWNGTKSSSFCFNSYHISLSSLKRLIAAATSLCHTGPLLPASLMRTRLLYELTRPLAIHTSLGHAQAHVGVREALTGSVHLTHYAWLLLLRMWALVLSMHWTPCVADAG